MKYKLTKEEYEALEDEPKKLYHERGGSYFLTIEGLDIGALERAKDHEAEERRKIQAKLDDLNNKFKDIDKEKQDAIDAALKKSGDIESLEKSWKERNETEKQGLQEQISSLQGMIQTQTVDNVALSLATELSTAPTVILPHIQKRLQSEIQNGQAVTRVLDVNGQPSAATLEDLKNEFLTSSDFAAIIIGTKASGASGTGKSGDSSAGKKTKFEEYKSGELVALKRTDPKKYAALKEDYDKRQSS